MMNPIIGMFQGILQNGDVTLISLNVAGKATTMKTRGLHFWHRPAKGHHIWIYALPDGTAIVGKYEERGTERRLLP